MTTARAFRGFRFPAEVVLWAVRWYLQFPVSYRDLEHMLADRGVQVDHVTLYRWVQRFTAGSSASRRNSRSGCGGTFDPAADRGTSMKPTSGSAVRGAPWTGRSTAPARRSTSGSVPSGTRRRPGASAARRSAGRTPATRGRS